ncbi:MbcA/ParS/Xre antitoxin family protein [Siccirubricoccus sp. KC 17139]|uniref:MbcA/ParS/Xre antitoxin family protein n=1 Tax=Siccirubricoccus soli TaxID=2899147 RepID=A0ABT1CY90_9PROT|nr:MbcA/ParS/Xre antitoxin family protein [Siccirubricoccus soli]MCP2680754.1 MbcA/ParS/Xre antitoxin family protein [Siccirubricoccus soli]
MLTHHFAHQADPENSCSASVAFETALHRLAKQVISERRRLTLPEVRASHFGRERLIAAGTELHFDTVEEEVWMGAIRPDIIATAGGKRLLVEVAVTHPCDENKIALLRSRDLAAVEIDLSDVPRDGSLEMLENAILHSAPRAWLHNTKLAAAQAELTALYEEEVRKAEEQRERKFAAAAAKLAAAYRSADLQRFDESYEPLGRVRDSDLAQHVGIEIAGSGCFAVEPWVWQSFLLAGLLSNVLGQHAYTEGVEKLLKPAFTNLAEQHHGAWQGLARHLPEEIRHPKEVVADYFKRLRDEGIAQYAVTGGTVLRPEVFEWARQRRERAAGIRSRSLTVLSLARSILPQSGAKDGSEVWFDRPLAEFGGLSPRKIAAAGGKAHQDLVGRLSAIVRMLQGGPAVEEDLLGLPVRGERDKRKREMVELQAARQRRQEEAERLAEASRRAAAEQEQQRVRDHLAKIRWTARSYLGDKRGDEWLRTPLSKLSGRSVEQVAEGPVSGWELSIVEEALNRRLAEFYAENQRDQERQDRAARVVAEATVTFGSIERARAWMRSPLPALQNRRPEEACADVAGLEACLAVLKGHRSRPAAKRR